MDIGDFGLPLTAGFNLPLFVDAPGASTAEVDYDIHWNARVVGVDYPDIRAAIVGGCVFAGFTGATSAPCPAEPNQLMTGLPDFPPQIPLDVGPADLNADGQVNLSDVGIVTSNFGQSLSGEANGDTTGDNFVGGNDLDVAPADFGIEPNRINVSAKLTFRVNAASPARMEIADVAGDPVFIGVILDLPSVNYAEDFNGFATGALSGQNGWTAGPSFNIELSGGPNPSNAVAGPTAPPGRTDVAHGQTLVRGQVLHLSWDAVLRSDSDELVSLSNLLTNELLMGVAADGLAANLILGSGTALNAFTFLDNEFYRFNVPWDTGAEVASISVTDIFGVPQAALGGVSTVGLDPSDLTHLGFRCCGTSGIPGPHSMFDNLRLTTPEPATLALLCLGMFQALRRRRCR